MMTNPTWKSREQLEYELKELNERYKLLEVDYNELYDDNVELYNKKEYYKDWVYSIVTGEFIILIFVILLYIKF